MSIVIDRCHVLGESHDAPLGDFYLGDLFFPPSGDNQFTLICSGGKSLICRLYSTITSYSLFSLPFLLVLLLPSESLISDPDDSPIAINYRILLNSTHNAWTARNQSDAALFLDTLNTARNYSHLRQRRMIHVNDRLTRTYLINLKNNDPLPRPCEFRTL